MNTRNRYKTILCGLLLLGRALLFADALDTQYQEALDRLTQSHDQRVQQILHAYRSHLDGLIAAAQPRGDIEAIVVYLDEKEAPGEAEPDERLRTLRILLTEQIRQVEDGRRRELLHLETQYVRGLELRLAEALRSGDDARVRDIEERLESARLRVAEWTPPEPEPEPEAPPPPERKYGPNLIPDGNFEEGGEDHWRLNVPGNTRNRSGFYSDTSGGPQRNRVLRVHQDSDRAIVIRRRVALAANTEYEISWRSRLSRPWRSGIELRGYGTYDISFRISEPAFARLPVNVQQSSRARVTRTRQPPRHTEWMTHAVDLRAFPHMDILEIRVHPGEGEWYIDDIMIRAILPTE